MPMYRGHAIKWVWLLHRRYCTSSAIQKEKEKNALVESNNGAKLKKFERATIRLINDSTTGLVETLMHFIQLHIFILSIIRKKNTLGEFVILLLNIVYQRIGRSEGRDKKETRSAIFVGIGANGRRDREDEEGRKKMLTKERGGVRLEIRRELPDGGMLIWLGRCQRAGRWLG